MSECLYRNKLTWLWMSEANQFCPTSPPPKIPYGEHYTVWFFSSLTVKRIHFSGYLRTDVLIMHTVKCTSLVELSNWDDLTRISPGTQSYWRDCISQLAWECLGTPQEELWWGIDRYLGLKHFACCPHQENMPLGGLVCAWYPVIDCCPIQGVFLPCAQDKEPTEDKWKK